MKILIVDDSEEIIHFLKNGFQYENYLVDTAKSAEEALVKLAINQYDFIILDLLLPQMDGMEFLKKIRGEGNMTPLIVLSSINDIETKIKLLQAGADDYIQKPFSLNELFARVRVILKRSKGIIQKTLIQIGDLTLNPTTHEVYRDERHINLRKKEYALLEYLALHAGQVVNHSILLEQVWDFNTHSRSNTLGSHISSLRKKIDKGFHKNLLQTVHGVGYRISEPT